MNEEILIVICFSLFIYMIYNKLQSIVINDNSNLITNYKNKKNINIEEIQLIISNYLKFETMYKQIKELDIYYNNLINIYKNKIKEVIYNFIINLTNTQLIVYKTLKNKKKHILFNNAITIIKNTIIKNKKKTNKQKLISFTNTIFNINKYKYKQVNKNINKTK